MVPSGTPGSFIAAMRQCRSDGQRQHPTGSGNISLPHIPGTPCRGNISTPCVPRGGQVVAIFHQDASQVGRSWHHSAAMHPRALADGEMPAKCVPPASGNGKISPRCAFGLSAVARYRHGAFSGCRPRQYFAAMRFRAAIRGGFFASCVPEGASDGKSASSWQHIAAMHPKRAGFGKIFAPCIRKAPQTAV